MNVFKAIEDQNSLSIFYIMYAFIIGDTKIEDSIGEFWNLSMQCVNNEKVS